MVQETALVHVFRNVLQSGEGNLDTIIASDRTPNSFSRTMFFCPVQQDELYQLLAKNHTPQSEEYKHLILIKRKQLFELYNGVAAFMMAIVNTDAIESMRHSLQLLNTNVDDTDTVLQELNQLEVEAESLIDRLALSPVDATASKKISDITQLYNTIVREKIIPNMDYGQTYYNLNVNLRTDNNRFKLYIKYGVTRQYTHFDSFERIMSYLEAAGFGYSHFAYTADGIDHRYSEHAQDSLKLHLSTMSNILFHLRPSANSSQETREIYKLASDIVVPSPLEPMELTVSSRNETTHHAAFLEISYGRLVDQFNRSKITLGSKEYQLVYCPPIAMLR